MCSSLSHRFGPLIRVRLMIGSAKTNIGHLEGGAVGEPGALSCCFSWRSSDLYSEAMGGIVKCIMQCQELKLNDPQRLGQTEASCAYDEHKQLRFGVLKPFAVDFESFVDADLRP